MIDFNNKSLIKLSPYSNEKANNLIAEVNFAQFVHVLTECKEDKK